MKFVSTVKMKLSILFSTLSILSIAAASPLSSLFTRGNKGHGNDDWKCIPETTATEIVNQFSSLLTAFNSQVAANLLSSVSFVDTSDSINFLGGFPLGGPTFPSAAAFIYGQGMQPPIGFDVLNIDAVTCAGVIAFRWSATINPAGSAVKGINVLYASNDPSLGGGHGKGVDGWVLTQVFSEFNSGTWLEDIGGTCTPPPPRPSA